jgi:retinol-binding protein 3
MTHLRLLVMSSGVTLFLASAPLRGQTTIPNTPAGQALRAFLDAFNSADSTRVAAFLSTYQVGFPFRNIFNFRQMTGGFDLLSVEVSEPRHIEYVMRHRNDPMTGYGTLDVAASNPKQINGTGYPIGPNVSVASLRIDRATRAAVVLRAAAILDSFYYSPTIGKQLSDSLHARLGRGAYNRYTTGPGLGIRLNAELDALVHDRHLWVRYSVSPLPPERPAEQAPPLPSREGLDETNCGFTKVEQLDGNIGYLRLDSFEEVAPCGSTATAALTFLAGTRALIIDLRENPGGKPEMVSFVASYLFDHRTHLGDLWDRYADSTHHYWTQDSVAGRRIGAAKPVYVLTSAHTFSAAEAFAYHLQALKRVTVVGETTAGGAHAASEGRLGDHFAINVPWGSSINPVTGTNWEGVGVVPDVKASADEALAVAQKLIRERAP